MENDVYIFLLEDENAALLTLDSEFVQAIGHSESDLLLNADALHALMIEVMKYSDARQGSWIWKVKNNWNTIEGWEL